MSELAFATGLGELAEASLAFNLAYIALDRFRYEHAIQKKYAATKSCLDGMPEEFQKDSAVMVINEAKEIKYLSKVMNNGKSHNYLSFWWYDKFIATRVDHYVSTFFIIFGFLVIVSLSCDAITTSDSLMKIYTEIPWIIHGLLTFSVFFIMVNIFFGRRSVAKVAALFAENVNRVASRYKAEANETTNKIIMEVEKLTKKLEQDW